jgi:hypothetical protein
VFNQPEVYDMVNPPRKTYIAPILTRYGAVEEITKAVIWPGSGDILSQIIESLSDGEINVPDGCPEYGALSRLCTGS